MSRKGWGGMDNTPEEKREEIKSAIFNMIDQLDEFNATQVDYQEIIDYCYK